MGLKPLQYAEIGLSTTAIILATGMTVYTMRRLNTTEERLRALTEAVGKRMMAIDSMGEHLNKVQQAVELMGKQAGAVARHGERVNGLADDMLDATEALEAWSRAVVAEIKLIRQESTLTPITLDDATPRGRRDVGGKRARGGGRGGRRGRAPPSDDDDDEEDYQPRRNRR